MKNVLYIAPSPSVKGGISAVIKGYLDSDLAKQHKIYLVSSHIDGPKFIKLVIAIWGLGKTLFYLLSKQIDIVHIHGSDIISSKRKFIYFKLVRLFNRKIIYHFHGASFLDQYPTASNIWKKRIREFFEQSNLVICLSESWESAILAIWPCSNIVVIPNSIRLPKLNPPEKKSDKGIQLTFLGLVGERKGIFDLLLAVKRLIDSNYDLRLCIGGNGEVGRLIKEINCLGINDSVEYLGWISESERDSLFRRTDIFVLPSYGEGMPMSILEAMSYGIPVVSTFVGGIPELVTNEKTGYLIHPGDLDALYEKIELLVVNEKRRKKFGWQGRMVIENNHNIDGSIRKIADIYDCI